MRPFLLLLVPAAFLTVRHASAGEGPAVDREPASPVDGPAVEATTGATVPSAEPVLTNDNPVILALRARHPAPCSALADDGDLAAVLHAIAGSDVAPAWVPLRAASCLTERFSTDARFVDWVTPWFTDDELGGLGFAALTTSLAQPGTRAVLEPLARAAPERWRDLYVRRLDAAQIKP